MVVQAKTQPQSQVMLWNLHDLGQREEVPNWWD